jgi:hypothetical protein
VVVVQNQERTPRTGESVSFRTLKEIYSKLPENSLVRRLVLSEPDILPRDIAKEKAFLYLEMLEKERGKVFSTLMRR